MPRFVADMLGVRIGTQLDDRSDALVFTSPQGGPLRHSNLHTRIWRPAIKAFGLPVGIRIHDLRHTGARFMIHEGAHLELVRKQLGHSSVTVTQRYAHILRSQGEDLAVRLDARRREARDRAVGFSGVGLLSSQPSDLADA
jgi:integrase